MTASPQHVQTLIDQATANLKLVTSRYAPNGKNWKPGLAALAAARLEAGELVAPTPPPPGGTIIWDGRAAKQVTPMFSTGHGEPLGSDLKQSDATPWTALAFANNTWTIVPDDVYGLVYKATIGPGDTSPWGGGLNVKQSCAGEMSHRRSCDVGKTDWFAMSVRIDSWSQMDYFLFAELFQLGYQTSQSAQCGITLMLENGVLKYGIEVNGGYWNMPPGSPWTPGEVSIKKSIMPVTLGERTEFVLGVHWSTHSDGFIEIHSRPAGGTWQKVLTINGANQIWGTTQNGSFPEFPDPVTTTVIDKQSLYYGFGFDKIAWPAETVYHNGMLIASDLATAQASFPA